MDGEPAELCDAVRAAAAREAHDPGPPAVGLDHEDPEDVRLLVGALDVGGMLSRSLGRDGGEERMHVLVLGEGDEEVEIVRPRAADSDPHITSSAVFARRHERTRPDPKRRRRGSAPTRSPCPP